MSFCMKLKDIWPPEHHKCKWQLSAEHLYGRTTMRALSEYTYSCLAQPFTSPYCGTFAHLVVRLDPAEL